MPIVTELDPRRLADAKAAYTTARVDFADAVTLIAGADVRPAAGDVMLAQVLQTGHHKKLELQTSRRAALFAGDEVLVCCGDRYAPDQFEAEICRDLGECDLVAAGGVAACVLSRHDATRKPTRLRPVGLLGDATGRPINLARYALPQVPHPKTAAVVAVLGASMNAGKTTAAASLVHGLGRAGLRVGAAKVTGTGAGGDLWLMADAGAYPALDFTAAGVPSTYKLPFPEVERVFRTLTGALMAAGADVLVLEVADGVYQRETAWLARSSAFRETVDGVLFAVRDALAASAGIEWFGNAGPRPLGLSGAITMAPLAVQEATEATSLPVFPPEELMRPAAARALIEGLAPRLAA